MTETEMAGGAWSYPDLYEHVRWLEEAGRPATNLRGSGNPGRDIDLTEVASSYWGQPTSKRCPVIGSVVAHAVALGVACTGDPDAETVAACFARIDFVFRLALASGPQHDAGLGDMPVVAHHRRRGSAPSGRGADPCRARLLWPGCHHGAGSAPGRAQLAGQDQRKGCATRRNTGVAYRTYASRGSATSAFWPAS
jgi:hypothetical protein